MSSFSIRGNKKSDSRALQELIEILKQPYKTNCIACGGSGYTLKGEDCSRCKGTGKTMRELI